MVADAARAVPPCIQIAVAAVPLDDMAIIGSSTDSPAAVTSKFISEPHVAELLEMVADAD
jgi:hypothetical protein